MSVSEYELRSIFLDLLESIRAAHGLGIDVELAGAFDPVAFDYDHSENYADYIAELCFSTPIYYDTEGVQTIAGGARPRPDYLPK